MLHAACDVARYKAQSDEQQSATRSRTRNWLYWSTVPVQASLERASDRLDLTKIGEAFEAMAGPLAGEAQPTRFEDFGAIFQVSFPPEVPLELLRDAGLSDLLPVGIDLDRCLSGAANMQARIRSEGGIVQKIDVVVWVHGDDQRVDIGRRVVELESIERVETARDKAKKEQDDRDAQRLQLVVEATKRLDDFLAGKREQAILEKLAAAEEENARLRELVVRMQKSQVQPAPEAPKAPEAPEVVTLPLVHEPKKKPKKKPKKATRRIVFPLRALRITLVVSAPRKAERTIRSTSDDAAWSFAGAERWIAKEAGRFPTGTVLSLYDQVSGVLLGAYTVGKPVAAKPARNKPKAPKRRTKRTKVKKVAPRKAATPKPAPKPAPKKRRPTAKAKASPLRSKAPKTAPKPSRKPKAPKLKTKSKTKAKAKAKAKTQPKKARPTPTRRATPKVVPSVQPQGKKSLKKSSKKGRSG
jgi:hypothetical protein